MTISARGSSNIGAQQQVKQPSTVDLSPVRAHWCLEISESRRKRHLVTYCKQWAALLLELFFVVTVGEALASASVSVERLCNSFAWLSIDRLSFGAALLCVMAELLLASEGKTTYHFYCKERAHVFTFHKKRVWGKECQQNLFAHGKSFTFSLCVL